MEYIIWGIAKGKEHEEPLYTLAKTLEAAERIMTVLSEDFGASNMRIQVLDLNEKPDFSIYTLNRYLLQSFYGY